jgi:hypothetical protein
MAPRAALFPECTMRVKPLVPNLFVADFQSKKAVRQKKSSTRCLSKQ